MTPTKLPLFAGTPYVPIPLMTGNPAVIPIAAPALLPPVVIVPQTKGAGVLLQGPEGPAGLAGAQG